MNALTLSLPDEVFQRLTQLATSRGVTVNQLMQELAQAAIVAHDAQASFATLAATSDRTLALAVLDRLDRHDQPMRP
jgi:predicted DNA-binding ribbon-helix-helix protein